MTETPQPSWPPMEERLEEPLQRVLERMQARILIGTTYFGIKTFKCPLDFWVYQELLYECQPEVVVEIGNFHGGSALALAHILDALGKGRIIAIDINQRKIDPRAKRHPRISWMQGDAKLLAGKVASQISESERVLIIEDSEHTYDNTLGVLRAYAGLVSPGSYLIVEDTNCHHGVADGPSPGPYEAVADFLAEDDRFEADRIRENFGITWNPRGYLRRVR
ncbi:CmcI family methyltransferase [Methylacidimicrobium tartarophylax]|uniref:Rhamnosyl O-methyltransferase n=1 Tax=Methylacidimicrobium tartarophylax TaxID=1041768 RepID=A0A5E6MBV4_9BACT|nr:CmcI family methyltransferase [Methylacidimicrobium tartarophylax]VVM05790.1 Rhamnosyl O-methyltransferase [Methylacidimicrobium tartarophylax]